MKNRRLQVNGLTVLLSASFSSCLHGAAEPRPVDTTVRIASRPSNAFVVVCPGSSFREGQAFPLGKTYLQRLMPLTESGSSVRIMKPGYQVWEGKLSAAAAEIKADLVPLTEAQKQELGWFASPPCRRLTVVPVRMGIQKIGSKTDLSAESPDAASFTNRFLTALQAKLKQRFGSQADLAQPADLVTGTFWQRLARQMEGINVATIGFRPVPKRLGFAETENASLAALDGAVLLVRAEAHYLSGGAVFVRSAIPLLLTAGSAAGSYAVAQSLGASFYTYSVFGVAPSKDAILVQMFLVHSSTRELMWDGRLLMPQYHKHAQVTENTAVEGRRANPGGVLGKALKISMNSLLPFPPSRVQEVETELRTQLTTNTKQKDKLCRPYMQCRPSNGFVIGSA